MRVIRGSYLAGRVDGGFDGTCRYGIFPSSRIVSSMGSIHHSPRNFRSRFFTFLGPFMHRVLHRGTDITPTASRRPP